MMRAQSQAFEKMLCYGCQVVQKHWRQRGVIWG